jgi:hypothetical protein
MNALVIGLAVVTNWPGINCYSRSLEDGTKKFAQTTPKMAFFTCYPELYKRWSKSLTLIPTDAGPLICEFEWRFFSFPSHVIFGGMSFHLNAKIDTYRRWYDPFPKLLSHNWVSVPNLQQAQSSCLQIRRGCASLSWTPHRTDPETQTNSLPYAGASPIRDVFTEREQPQSCRHHFAPHTLLLE